MCPKGFVRFQVSNTVVSNGLEVLGGNIHFDIKLSGYLVISEFVIEGVDCISSLLN